MQPALAHAKKGEHSMLLDKPYFTLYVEVADCQGPIQFNGQELSFEDGSTNYTEYPVNQWIKQGENKISMFLFYGEDNKDIVNSDCKMTLQVRKSGSESTTNTPIATLIYSAKLSKVGSGFQSSTPEGRINSKNNFESDKNGDIIIGEATGKPDGTGIVLTSKITLPKIGLPKWAFFDSDNITSLKVRDIWGSMDDATHDRIVKEILPIYRKIWTALKDKDVDSIMPLYAERSKEMDAAFYNPPGQLLNDLKSAFKHAIKDPERKLQPIDETNVTAHMFDNDKLVNLQHNNNKPVIYFKYNDGMVEYYDIILRKQGDRWIITR